jgi:Tfp pilus assembly protein PilF
MSVRNDAYDARAWAYFKAGQAARALPDVERSLRQHPSDARPLNTRGNIYEALGKREEAIADFRRALSLSPNDQELQASSKEALKRLGADPDSSP